jgi:hypothetical protein
MKIKFLNYNKIFEKKSIKLGMFSLSFGILPAMAAGQWAGQQWGGGGGGGSQGGGGNGGSSPQLPSPGPVPAPFPPGPNGTPEAGGTGGCGSSDPGSTDNGGIFNPGILNPVGDGTNLIPQGPEWFPPVTN